MDLSGEGGGNKRNSGFWGNIRGGKGKGIKRKG